MRNRVKNLHKSSKGESKYCPGNKNPTDYLMNGFKAEVLVNDCCQDICICI